MPEETDKQETQNKNEPENQPLETPNDGLEEFIIDGEVVKLDRAAKARAINVAYQALKEKAQPKEEPKKEESKKDDDRVAALERRLQEKEDREKEQVKHSRIVNAVVAKVQSVTDDADAAKFVAENTLAKIALAMATDPTADINSIIDKTIQENKKLLDRLQPTVDAKKKLENADITRKTVPSNKDSGQEEAPKFSRHDFRTGKLAKAVYADLKTRFTKAVSE